MFFPDIFLTLKFGDKLFTDAKRIALLKAIAQTGSLSQAARLIHISYKTAWDAIDDMNKLAEQPFVITSTGGKGGGGAQLSQYALRFIQLYDLLTHMQSHAFSILKDETIPLNNVLNVAAKVSLQSSARNQFYGTIIDINNHDMAGLVTVLLQDKITKLSICVTQSSIHRLDLIPGKEVILLIKAPQVEVINRANTNHYLASVSHIMLSQYWCEMMLSLSSGLEIYASRPIDEYQQLQIKQGQMINIYIHPENIIVATLAR
ncbi:molybdate transport repressor ModE [Orbus hercynius]|uniref:Molybdate transport repressor ModE n=1 Tax=Orbus hercynius TaxID=593135 RepID=A0A495RCM8_9GAMM|nr:TOBE domain-containing protein [Orbus hercynius]RKS85101.1 molybdate transport repressor ModE [Orbus hercynius]